MGIVSELQHALEEADESMSMDRAYALADTVRELLDEPTNVQALELARLMRDRRSNVAEIAISPFELPAGYWRVTFADGFECGIAPDGSVSS